MLDQETRQAILALTQRGHSVRAIARTLGIARITVRKVVKNGAAVPRLFRPERADPYRTEILGLFMECKGNLVRVHEELVHKHQVALSYQALTAYCRRQGIGQEPKEPAGHYHFEPGQEMQHDTSPHKVHIGGRLRDAHTASLVLCYSRILFFQFYPQFRRFECKLFLTEAFRYMDGVCGICMIDNTHVVVLVGTGKDMVPVPEMEAFGRRLGPFSFAAHEKNDPNRKGRVEAPFRFIENNYLAGRRFADWDDANRQAREWCDRVNGTYKKHIRAIPRELYQVEHPRLRRLPIWVPDPYLLHDRIVDCDAYVTVNTNRYSVLPDLIGRRVEVRESKDRVVIYLGPREVASHVREAEPIARRITDPAHRPPRGKGPIRQPFPDEKAILAAIPEIADYLARLKQRGRLQATLAMRQLLRMVREYPREPLLTAIRTAAHYGLYDLRRLETLVLRAIADDYFLLPLDPEPPEEENEQ
jgi:transposase